MRMTFCQFLFAEPMIRPEATPRRSRDLISYRYRQEKSGVMVDTCFAEQLHERASTGDAGAYATGGGGAFTWEREAGSDPTSSSTACWTG